MASGLKRHSVRISILSGIRQYRLGTIWWLYLDSPTSSWMSLEADCLCYNITCKASYASNVVLKFILYSTTRVWDARNRYRVYQELICSRWHPYHLHSDLLQQIQITGKLVRTVQRLNVNAPIPIEVISAKGMSIWSPAGCQFDSQLLSILVYICGWLHSHLSRASTSVGA